MRDDAVLRRALPLGRRLGRGLITEMTYYVSGGTLLTCCVIRRLGRAILPNVYIDEDIGVIYGDARGTGTPTFGLRGTVLPLFQDEKVKNVLSTEAICGEFFT